MKRRRFPLPHLHLIIDLKWFGVRTDLMYESWENASYSYIGLVFWCGKHQQSFRLYSPEFR